MNQIESLLKKIEDRSYTVGIVGLGYVGLPLMWAFHQNDMPVLGFDIDEKKVENLRKGTPYIKLPEWCECVSDTRNAMSGIDAKSENQIFKA